MAPTEQKKHTSKRSAMNDIVTREYTINIHKAVHGRSFKKRAPWAIKSVNTFAMKAMGVKRCVLDPRLNQAIWARGVRSPPTRLRVRLERKRSDSQSKELYVYASFVPVESFKGLQTTAVEAE